MEGISTEDMELYPQPAVLKALLEHLSAKRAQSVAGGSAADKIKQLRAMHKVDACASNAMLGLFPVNAVYRFLSTRVMIYIMWIRIIIAMCLYIVLFPPQTLVLSVPFSSGRIGLEESPAGVIPSLGAIRSGFDKGRRDGCSV